MCVCVYVCCVCGGGGGVNGNIKSAAGGENNDALFFQPQIDGSSSWMYRIGIITNRRRINVNNKMNNPLHPLRSMTDSYNTSKKH